eukprot:scaffold30440_cov52-Cyclotella_meneghiniana.AAC.1
MLRAGGGIAGREDGRCNSTRLQTFPDRKSGSLTHTQPWCEKWSPQLKYLPSTAQKSACGEHCGQ